MAFLTDVLSTRAPITLSSLLQGFREMRRRHAVRREIIEELSALSDRELTDLNISRVDVGRIADEAARRA